MKLSTHNQSIERVQKAVADFRQGKMVILVDDEDRENEGDLVVAAEKITPEIINFMARFGRGLICLSLTEEQVERLSLPMMVANNTSKFQTGFTVSIEARLGVTTGISAKDRATTIQTAIQQQATPQDIVTPGHVFPLKARKGGVLVRAGQTEGSVDLARLAGLNPSAVICEIMKDDGTMARRADLEVFAKEHNLCIVSVADLITYRMSYESYVHLAAESRLPTQFGEFQIKVFSNEIDDHLHIALVFGELSKNQSTLVRVHSECLTGDIFASLRCDCGHQLHAAMAQVAKEGSGVILYVRQEGRGIGLVNKIRAYQLQDQGRDTVEANEELGFESDLRDYGVGAQVLSALGIKKIRLITNNPRKIVGLEGYGLEVVDRVSVEMEPTLHSEKYLRSKKEKMGHLLKKV